MTDQDTSEKSEHPLKAHDRVLQNADAQDARNSGKVDIASAEKLRTNQSDGSLRRFKSIDLSDQDQSIEISYGDNSSSRVNKLTEAELLQSQKKAAIEDQSETIEEMRQVAKITPTLGPVLALREHAQTLPPGPDKDKYRELALSQAKEVSPDMAAYLNAREGNSTSANCDNTLSGKVTDNHFAGDLQQAFAELGKLPLDKQISVLSAGFMAGYEQYRNEEKERSWGRLIGSVERFGTALGTATFQGVQLFAAADKCLYDTGFTGDYTLPFRQIATVGAALNERWSQVPPREQERLKYKLITEMVAEGLIGAGGAKALGSAKSFTGLLDAVAVESGAAGKGAVSAIEGVGKQVATDFKGMSQDVPIAGQRASRFIDDLVCGLTAPEMALPGGGSIEFPRGFARPTERPLTHVFMSAAEDAEGSGKRIDIKIGGKEPKEISELYVPKSGSLTKIEARDWYNAKVADIETVENEMRMANRSAKEIFERTTDLRNEAKQKARDLMKDRHIAEQLSKDRPLKAKEEILAKYDGDYEKAIAASKRTNRQVNQYIEDLRKQKEQQSNEGNI